MSGFRFAALAVMAVPIEAEASTQSGIRLDTVIERDGSGELAYTGAEPGHP